MNQAVAVPLLASQLAAGSAARSTEPGWLGQLRQQHREALLAAGMPGPRSETWKYTQLRPLAQRSYASPDPAAIASELDPALWQIPGLDGPVLVFVNGLFRADYSRLQGLPDGVRLQPLSSALVAGQDDELQALWQDETLAADDVIRRLNAAVAAEGLLLTVAAGVQVSTPIQVVHLAVAAEPAQAWHLRNLIQLEAGASLCLLEQHLGSGDAAHLYSLSARHRLAAGAQLQQVIVQHASTAASVFRHGHYQLAEGAHGAVHAVELGGGLVRHELQVELLGQAASFDTRGIMACRGRQHVDTQLQLLHAGRDSRSDALWRGVADQRSRVVFRGAIVVAAGADGSDASLANKNLLLSAQAEIDTKPELEIYADEVKAAHGATVGQLDERALFYLRSRGIPLEQARRMLMAAFCREVLDQVPDPALLQHVSELLLAQLPQAAD